MSDERRLLPELLPVPVRPGGRTPKERVAERARLLLERFRSLGPAASAAVLGIHCSYAVVDPLPPPAAACSTSTDWSDEIVVQGKLGDGPPGTTPPVLLDLRVDLVGIQLEAVRVKDGALVGSPDRREDYFGLSFELTLEPERSSMQVELDLGCGGQRTTKRYTVTVMAASVHVLELK